MKQRRRILVFTDTYPLFGPLIWMLCFQYFLVQIVVASAWHPAYNWATNLISDLGNTACGTYANRFVCSPQHGLMNASFILLGLTMATGALLIYQEFQETKLSLVGFTLMGLAGVGSMLVGAFPENTVASAHFGGAILALVVGNLSIVLLSFGLRKVQSAFKIYSFISGIVSLAAVVLFELGVDFGLGQGTIERIVSYPQTLWLIIFGLYMSAVRVRARYNARTS